MFLVYFHLPVLLAYTYGTDFEWCGLVPIVQTFTSVIVRTFTSCIHLYVWDIHLFVVYTSTHACYFHIILMREQYCPNVGFFLLFDVQAVFFLLLGKDADISHQGSINILQCLYSNWENWGLIGVPGSIIIFSLLSSVIRLGCHRTGVRIRHKPLNILHTRTRRVEAAV